MDIVEKNLFNNLNVLLSQKHTNNFIVDIGASYNSHFLNYPLRGILFELDPMKIMRIPSNNLYTKINDRVTPYNIINYLEKNNTPKDFLALNLDIDSYDLFVLINLLKVYSPKIIISEINEKIPYPINFSVLYDDKCSWKGDHFFGYSISCLELILKHFGYYLYETSYNNVILIKGDKEFDIKDSYNKGYVNALQRKEIFTWNNNVEHWQTCNDATSQINDFFCKYKGKYVIGEECVNIIKSWL